jgi:predicted nucleic acid-binding protein
MSFFVDTSAFLAVLDADDENHQNAREKWKELISQNAVLVCSNYILVETLALIQNRLGMEALRAFQEDVVPLLTIHWVNESVHQVGVMGVLAAAKRKLSLVDCVSFDVIRQLGIKSVFAFDRHFKEQGFECVP